MNKNLEKKDIKKVSIEEIKKLAELSRIKISNDEAEKFSNQFSDILSFIGKINEIKTDKNTVSRNFQNLNTFREDIVKKNKNRGEILNEMLKITNGYLEVKKILKND